MTAVLDRCLGRLNQLTFVPEPPNTAGGVLSLFRLRLMLGTDWLALFKVDAEGGLECVVDSSTCPTSLSIARLTGSVARAFKQVPQEKWMKRFHRATERGDEYVSFDRDDLKACLGGYLETEELPCAAGVGWWFSDGAIGPVGFYVAAWTTEDFRINFDLNMAVHEVHNYIYKYVTSGADVVAEPDQMESADIIKELRWNREIYPLRTELHWLRDIGSKRLFVEGFSPRFIGEGNTLESCWDDFRERIHLRFQALYQAGSFNRTEKQDDVWRLLCRLIDMDQYRALRPRRLIRLGKIARQPHPEDSDRIVFWVNQRKAERVPLDRASQGFESYQRGDWFEAEVEFDSRTMEFQRIVGCKPVDPVPVTRSEALDSLKKPSEEPTS
jgi:hypothetical protein